MPAQEIAYLNDFAVLWEVSGTPGPDGRPRVGDPVEINCRKGKKRRTLLGANNTTIVLDAWAVVEREIKAQSIMWFGRLANWTGTGVDNELMEVVYYDEESDLKGRDIYREVGLMRFMNSLPS